jgi:hypothetical protein
VGEERSSRKEQEKLASSYIKEFKKDPKCWEYNMSGHARSAVEKYLNLAKLSETLLKKVSTPCIDDHQISDEDLEVKGHLDHIASQIILTCLYLAGHNRPDILWSVNYLARNITSWSVADDKRLHRLILYLHHARDYIQFCFVGDEIEDCFIIFYVETGFAGCLGDSRSTGGAFIYFVGPQYLRPDLVDL